MTVNIRGADYEDIAPGIDGAGVAVLRGRAADVRRPNPLPGGIELGEEAVAGSAVRRLECAGADRKIGAGRLPGAVQMSRSVRT